MYGRNFPVADCGVADLLLCQSPIGILQDTEMGHVHLTAFEMKLSDWRKALQQAYQYKYYADLSVVVLPEKAAVHAIQSISLFEALGVDLWTLNTATGDICRHVAHPPGTGPLNTTKRSQALSRLRSRFIDLRLPHEEI